MAHSSADTSVAEVEVTTASNAAKAVSGGAVEWQQAHEALVRLARSRAALDFEEGILLRAAVRSRVHERLGYGNFSQYVERLFGYAPRLTQDKLRVAEALEGLPELARSLRDGSTTWSSLRELTRVATPETERAWLEAARGRTARDVERLVSGRSRGSLPSDAADPNAVRHVLRFEVSAEVLATFREAMNRIRRDAGGSLDDDEALLSMSRHVLGGPTDEGRASYQVALTVCEDCQRTQQRSAGELIDVPREILEMACCDAQRLATHVGASGAGAPAQRRARAKQEIPPARRREVIQRDHCRCQVPGCRHANFVDVHHIETRADGGDHEADNLIVLCGAHHRAIHRGDLIVQGRVGANLRFRHADGSEYGQDVCLPLIDVRSRAFRALRGLGFGEGEVRRALDQATEEASNPINLDSLLRGTLELLTSKLVARAS